MTTDTITTSTDIAPPEVRTSKTMKSHRYDDDIYPDAKRFAEDQFPQGGLSHVLNALLRKWVDENRAAEAARKPKPRKQATPVVDDDLGNPFA